MYTTFEPPHILIDREIPRQQTDSPSASEWMVVLFSVLMISALTWAGVIWVVSRSFIG